MHAQTISTTARAPALADEATPVPALKAKRAALAGPACFAPPTKSRVRLVNIDRIYPAELKARVDKLAAIETKNEAWPELLEAMEKVSPEAGRAVRLQFDEKWDLDLAADFIIAVCGKTEDEDGRHARCQAICSQHVDRLFTRLVLSDAAERWIKAFRANGGSFDCRDGAARGTCRDIEGTTPRQRAYTNDLLNLAFPHDENGQALPSLLGDAIWAEVEAEMQDPLSIAAE